MNTERWALMADVLDPLAPPPKVRGNFVAQIRGPQRFAPFAGEIAATFGADRDHTLATLARVDEAEAWRAGLLPGSRILKLDGPPATRLMLARIPAGSRIPHHTHATRERIYVIQGMLLEDGGRSYACGELIDKQPGTEHELAVAGTGECLVVFEEARD